MTTTGQSQGRPVVFGEVLFDHFPDGSRVLGGAPFNVAWHLHGFGLNPVLITRVGEDREGDAIIATMEGWGMKMEGVQIDPARATGAVDVQLEESEPSYTIHPERAFDYITVPENLNTSARDVLYFGSLACRCGRSQSTLQTLCAMFSGVAFVDLNLRAPWWQAESVTKILGAADWLKLNADELVQLGYSSDAARRLLQDYHLQGIWLTDSAAGASVIDAHQTLRRPAPAPVAFVDSVGAGDAFSAVSISGLLRDWPLAVTLERALAFASRICSQRGATANTPELYERTLEEWRA